MDALGKKGSAPVGKKGHLLKRDRPDRTATERGFTGPETKNLLFTREGHLDQTQAGKEAFPKGQIIGSYLRGRTERGPDPTGKNMRMGKCFRPPLKRGHLRLR